jgi:hypothetical protein
MAAAPQSHVSKKDVTSRSFGLHGTKVQRTLGNKCSLKLFYSCSKKIRHKILEKRHKKKSLHAFVLCLISLNLTSKLYCLSISTTVATIFFGSPVLLKFILPFAPLLKITFLIALAATASFSLLTKSNLLLALMALLRAL